MKDIIKCKKREHRAESHFVKTIPGYENAKESAKETRELLEKTNELLGAHETVVFSPEDEESVSEKKDS
jgi:hypothetical protein